MLGHADLRNTQIYTQVSIRKLKEVHTACHAAARLCPGWAGADAENQREGFADTQHRVKSEQGQMNERGEFQ